MNGERRDQSNLVFRYAMPLEFILDRIIRFDPSLLLIIAIVLKISYRYLCHWWKIANRSRRVSYRILIVNANTQIIEPENCSNAKNRRKKNKRETHLLRVERSDHALPKITWHSLLVLYFHKTFYRMIR